jgi:putative restriction endonuclease
MCEMDYSQLLIASHIIPWSEDRTKRGLFENVMCLCILHDSLFEKGLLTVRENYKIEFSDEFLNKCKNSNTYTKIKEITFERLRMPQSLPYLGEELLMKHRKKFK